MARKPDVGQLRDDAAKALERGKLDRAIELYAELEAAEPAAPAWPKKIGETHRRAGAATAAVAAFERAAQKYALAGFLVQAIAVCKMILQIDPQHSATQVRLSELMPKPAKPREETAPLVYEDDTDEPVRELPPEPPLVRLTPRAETAPATPAARTSTRDHFAAAAGRATARARTEDEPPAPRTSTRDFAAAAARVRDDKAALREVLRQRDEAAARDPRSEPRTGRPPTTRPPSIPGAPAPHDEAQPRDTRDDAVAAVRDDKAALREVLRQRDEVATRDASPAPTRLPRARTAPASPAARSPQKPPARRAREVSLPAMIVDRKLTVTIPPGGGLDQIDLSTLIPGSIPMTRRDGTFSGVHLLPLGERDDLELSLDDAEPVDERQPGLAARRALLTTPLFPQVSPRVLEQLIEHMSLLELAPDEILFREGETGNELFVISEGEVAVESQGVGELARLGPSAFFGEIALVTDLPRSATIRAISRVELLAIDRGVIREASKDHPEIITVLLRFVRDRLIDRIMRTSELFAPFAEPERHALSAKFELVEVVPDAILITQGERADGLYLVVAGRVEVWRDGEGALATLGSGDVFGELSLLAGGGSTANVRATTRALALRMPAATFQEVIMTHPQVLAYLGELAERRTPRVQAEKFVDLHLDMLV